MPRSKTKAVIWDMDGVIADTAPYHLKAWQEAFHKRGINFTEDDFRRNFGQRNDTIIRNTLGEQISQSDLESIAREKEVAPKDCIVIEDAIAGVAACKRAGMHCLAVTNTHPRESLTEADLIVATLEEVAVADLERLLNSDKQRS